MRIKYGEREYQAIRPDSREMRMADLAALQRETGWKMAQVNEMGQLEVVGLQMVVFFTFRKNGQLITFAKAGDLLDEAEFLPDEGDLPPEGEADPTPALTGSVQGDGAAAVSVEN